MRSPISTLYEARRGGNDCNLPDSGRFGRKDDPRCGMTRSGPVQKAPVIRFSHVDANADVFLRAITGNLRASAIDLVKGMLAHTPDGLEWDITVEVAASMDPPRLSVSGRIAGVPDMRLYRDIYRRKDGTLVAYHDTLEVPDEQAGLAKHLLRGHVEAYEKLGVRRIETIANISVGGYAWARYGFTSEAPDVFAARVRDRVRALAANGWLSLSQARAVHDLVDDDTNVRAPWDVSDLRVRMPPDVLLPIVDRPFPDEDKSTYGRRVADATEGVLNIGKLVLGGLAWRAALDLRDPASMRRFRSYVG